MCGGVKSASRALYEKEGSEELDDDPLSEVDDAVAMVCMCGSLERYVLVLLLGTLQVANAALRDSLLGLLFGVAGFRDWVS